MKDTHCALCAKELRKPKEPGPSGGVFYSRECWHSARRTENPANVKLPSHYGTAKPRTSKSRREAKKVAFVSHPHECGRCGWDTNSRVLVVHHLDGDHTRNEAANLQLLCPNCHRVVHFQEKYAL